MQMQHSWIVSKRSATEPKHVMIILFWYEIGIENHVILPVLVPITNFLVLKEK